MRSNSLEAVLAAAHLETSGSEYGEGSLSSDEFSDEEGSGSIDSEGSDSGVTERVCANTNSCNYYSTPSIIEKKTRSKGRLAN